MAASLVLVVLAAGLALQDMAGANRPHELTLSPVVTLILTANAAVLWRAWRSVRGGGLGCGWRRLVGVAALLVHSALSALLLLLAASTAVEVLLAG